MIYLFQLNNQSPLTQVQDQYLKKCLPLDIYLESLKYRRWQDRQAYIGARYLLLIGLKKLHIPIGILSDLKYTQYGRPYIPLDIDFNISHSGNLIILAISDNCKVGIDIEAIREIEVCDYAEQFSDLELITINKSLNKYAEFFKYWTLKEAVIKADGRGMSINMKHTLFKNTVTAEGKIWYWKEIMLPNGYVGHIATNLIINSDIKYIYVEIPDNCLG